MKTNSIIKRLGALILAGTISSVGAFAADATGPAPAVGADSPATAATPAPAKPGAKHHRKHHRAEGAPRKTASMSQDHRVWFGGTVENSSLSTGRAHHKAPDVKIAKVVRNGPAYNAGLEAGDVIWKLDGERLTEAAQFRRELREQKPGDSVRLEIYRHGKREDVKVKLGTAPVATASHPFTSAHLHG
jgi:membrane-associated protease RseP (regulator of RpoE activity)